VTQPADGIVLNDVHSALDPTRVARVVRPTSVADVVTAVRGAAIEGLPISVSGSRHAMGGQQVAAAGAVHVDMRALNRILALDSDAGRSMPATLASEPSSQPSVASILRSGS
jgi:FAD/FMN-containing dehydrogenase